MCEKRKRVGIMGGTFDPIHIGHLILGETAYEQFDLDQVLFMPAGNPPHKRRRLHRATDEQRSEMVKRAIASNPHFSVGDIFKHAQNPYTIKLLGYRNYGKGIGHTHGRIHFHDGMPHTHGGTHDHMHPRVEGDISHPAVQVEEKIVRDDRVVLLKEPDPEKLIEIQHLSKNFRLDRHTVSRVLEDFSLDVYRGEILGVAWR